MSKRYFPVIIFLLLIQYLSCASIYRSGIDERDTNYKEGVELYKQNKFAAAHDHFRKVVEIEPDYKDAKSYLAKIEKQMALNVQTTNRKANINYEKGVSMMNSGRYDDALRLFLLAQEQEPAHVDVDKKIAACREKLAPKFDQLVKQAEIQYQRKAYIPAYQMCIKAKPYNPSNSQLLSLLKKIESTLDEKSGIFFDKGKQLYSQKRYTAAQTQLQFALKANPWDKNAKELLDKTNDKLNLDKNYQRGVYLYNSANYFGAKAVFHQVNEVESGYKSTTAYMTKINIALAGQIDTFYNNGVSYYDRGNYKAAIGEFNKVLEINPSHRNAQEYYQRTQTKIDIQKSVGGEESE